MITPNGDRCPIGWLLPKQRAWELQETGENPSSLDVARVIFGPDADEDDAALLELLRQAHDDAACFPEDFVEELEWALRRLMRWLSS